MEYEYKVIDVADGAISSLLLGEGRIETEVLEAYINAMIVARDVLSGEAEDRSQGATHYYAPQKANPSWASAYNSVSVVGNHRFLR